MAEAAPPSATAPWRRFAPLGAIALALALFIGLRLDRYVSLELFVDSRAPLLAFIGQHFASALCAFAAVYAALVAISAPGATLMTLAGGAFSHWPLILWMLLGAIAMRGAGCVYNDIVDRDLDAKVARTASRPRRRCRSSCIRHT